MSQLSPYSHEKGGKKTPVVCAGQMVIRTLAQASGVDAVSIWVIGKKSYHLSFRIKNQEQEWYLTTARNKKKPRTFSNMGAAAHLAHRISHIPIINVYMTQPHR